MAKKALVIICNGTEETEAISVVDLLRRANISVKVAGDNPIVTCSRGVKILPDILLENITNNDTYDVIILPGGLNGVLNFSKNLYVSSIVKKHYEQGKLLAAICAAPSFLIEQGIIKKNENYTGFPSLKDEYPSFQYVDKQVVVNKNIITSQGLGTSIIFSLKIIETILSSSVAQDIARDICWATPAS